MPKTGVSRGLDREDTRWENKRANSRLSGGQAPAGNPGTVCLAIFVAPLGTARFVTGCANSRLSGRLHLPMDNGKCIMDNEGVAFGDIFEIIENTTIIHYQLSIIHSCVSTQNGNLWGKKKACRVKTRHAKACKLRSFQQLPQRASSERWW